MNLSKKSPTNGAQALQRPAGAKGQLEPLDQRLWKHVGGGDYPRRAPIPSTIRRPRTGTTDPPARAVASGRCRCRTTR